MTIAPRQGLFGTMALCLVAFIALQGCATTGQKETYMQWLSVQNPSARCNGQNDCVQQASYRGKPLCTIVTADRDVSFARLGEQMRECMQ